MRSSGFLASEQLVEHFLADDQDSCFGISGSSMPLGRFHKIQDTDQQPLSTMAHALSLCAFKIQSFTGVHP
jgi:hypothetical protein